MHESHGASNTIIWEGSYTSSTGSPVTLVIQDVLSIHEKHNKLRIVVRQDNTEIFHFVNATHFLVFAYEYFNDIRNEQPSFYEFKGSPNLRSEGHTARTIKFETLKHGGVYLEVSTGSGVLQGDAIIMSDVLNKVDLGIPSSQFKAICFKLINYAQAKLVATMMGHTDEKPKRTQVRKNPSKCISN